MAKPVSKDVELIFNEAANRSRKYYHTFCGTPHLFLQLFSFLSNSVKNGEERYKETYNTLKGILNKYGINGKTFENSFLIFCPAGEKPAPGERFEISPDQDYSRVHAEIATKAQKEKRVQEVEDFITCLFSDKVYMIHTIFSDITGSDTETDKMYDEIVKTFVHQTMPEIEELDELPELTNLNKWVKEHPQVVIGSDEPVMNIEMALSGRSIKNAILTGPAGTGKTTYVYEFVQRINAGKVPEQFKNKIVYELSGGDLVAGTSYRGQFEEKLQNILNTVKEHPEVILFIDEIHSFLDLGGNNDGAQGAGQLIKPYITRGELTLIGATTNEEYTKHILKDKAFARRFHEIKIKEPNRADTKKILQGLLPVQTQYFNREIQEDLLDRVLELSEKYTLDQANPAIAINMLELACAYSKVFEENNTIVDVDDVIKSVKLKYGIFISKDKLPDTRKELFKVLLGQDKALNQVLRDLAIVDSGVVDLEKPLWSMLLAGPTGTGKTETCKIIAKAFFGSEENLVKVNMGEYSAEMDVSKLTGSSAGYVGYDDEPALIKGVRQKPNSVVLFDEIEKAHPSVQKVLLNILDEGEMKDNKGNRVSFRNCIIVFTTNLGCTKDTGKATGMGFVKTVVNKGNSEVKKAIEDYFSPEFLGRLDDIVYYDALTKDIASDLIKRYFNEYKERANLKLKLKQEDIDDITRDADIETRGARGLRKAVKKHIVDMINKEKETEASLDF